MTDAPLTCEEIERLLTLCEVAPPEIRYVKREFLEEVLAALPRALREVLRLREELQQAATYRGIEAYPCPLCRYENGVYIESCEMHRKIDRLYRALHAAGIVLGSDG